MSTGRIVLPHDGWSPRPHQLKAWAAMRDPAKRTFVLAWHRRAGKDDVSLHDTALRITQRVGNYWHMLPEQEQARKAIWEAVNPRTGRVRWRDAFPDELIRHVDNQSMKLTFHNGATWQVLGSDNYQCFSEDTEILTENGWVFFKDLTGKEQVATLDNDHLVYAPINHLLSYPYNGEMIRLKSKSIDQLTTPNHRYYVQSSKGVRKFKRADDPTIGGDKIPATSKWVGKNIPTFKLKNTAKVNGQWKEDYVEFSMRDWCALVGIWLAEGSTYDAGRSGKRVTISQKKGDTAEEIRDLLTRMGIPFKYDKNPGNFVITNVSLFDYFAPLGNQQERFVPRDLIHLSKEYLQILSDWMIKGDGTARKDGTLIYFSTSKKLIDDFQEIMIKLGYSGNISIRENKTSYIKGRKITSKRTCYAFSRRRSKFKYFKDTHESYISREHYEGNVWCVEAGSHVIKVRRNGFECWSGNSLVGTTPVHIVMSEAALADPNAFAFFRPILLENNGTSVHISSTRGKNHFYDLFQAYKNRPNAFAQVLSAYDTSIFTPQQLAEELQDYKHLWGDAVGEMLFKQEYLSEWNAASAGTIFGKSLALIKDDGRAMPLPYDPRFPVNTSWDLGVGDDTVILFWQSVGGWERLIDWYADTDIGIDTYADVLLSKPYRYAHHVAPHDIQVREWGNKAQTRLQTAANYGINFKQMPRMSKAESIAAGDMLLRRTLVNVVEKENKLITDDCEAILSQLDDYRFKFNKVTRQYTTTPEHNRASNYADALMTYAIFVSGATEAYTGVKEEMESRTQAYEDQRLIPLLRKLNRPRRRINGFN